MKKEEVLAKQPGVYTRGESEGGLPLPTKKELLIPFDC